MLMICILFSCLMAQSHAQGFFYNREVPGVERNVAQQRINRTCPEMVERNCSHTVRVSYIRCPPGVMVLNFFRQCIKYRNEIRNYPCTVLEHPCCKGYALGPDNYCQETLLNSVSGCGGPRLIRNTSGALTTPNYPEHYADNLNCTWTIEVPRSKVTIMKIMDIDTETSRGFCDKNFTVCNNRCEFDYVEVRNRENGQTRRFCGNLVPQSENIFIARVLDISFSSDTSINGKGFKLAYSVISSIDIVPRSRCVGGQKWNLCRRVCQMTCDDANALDRPPSRLCLQGDGTYKFTDISKRNEITCRPGCACPKDKPIWHEGECVKLEKCERRSFMCGAPIPGPSRKILGGDTARDGAWPWMVQITKNDLYADCAGSLICSDWVITAAHCLVDFTTWERPESIDLNRFWFHLGKYWKYQQRDGRRIESYRAAKIIIHPTYNFTSDMNDLALVKLAGYAQQWDRIRPICLPPPFPEFIQTEKLWTQLRGFPGVGEQCIALGWGANRDIGPSSSVLKQVNLPIQAVDRCNYQYFNWRTTICAGGLSDADTCQGDSGGPFMCMNRNGLWHIYGITSFGRTCGTGTPGGYTRVGHFVNWIREKIGNQCEN